MKNRISQKINDSKLNSAPLKDAVLLLKMGKIANIFSIEDINKLQQVFPNLKYKIEPQREKHGGSNNISIYIVWCDDSTSIGERRIIIV